MALAPPAFDGSRVQHHHDKVLLARIGEYFEAFASGDYDKMDAMVADEYRMSDICKSSSLSLSLLPSPFLD